MYYSHWHSHGASSSTDDILGKAYDQRIMGRLIKYLGPYKLKVALSGLAVIVYSLTSLATPYLIKVAIDQFIVQRDFRGLDILFALFVANGLVNWVSQYWQLISMAQVSQNILYTIRRQMFEHLQRLSLSFFDRHEVGRLMSRVQNDVQELQELLTGGILTTLGDVLTLGGIVVVMFSMNGRLALLTFTVLPLMFLMMTYWQHLSRESFRRVRRAIAMVNAGLQENISGVRVVQSLSREEVNIRRFGSMNEEHLEANLQAGRLSALILPMVEILMALAIALVIVYGGMQVFLGELSAGALVAFILYIQRFFDPIRDLSMRYTQMQRAMIGGERICELLDAPPEVVDAPQPIELSPIKGHIHFNRVSFAYREGTNVLHDINLEVAAGETIALVGPTGAGKSTLVSLIGRFYEVKKGVITIDGIDLRQIKLRSLRRQLGIVLQDPFLFSGTIRDNIRYGRLEAEDEEVVAAAQAVGAHDFIQRLERGYDTEVQERGINLSVGQRQLISFARALLANPRILILDEATANVDTQTEVAIQRALKKLLKGRTAFVIAHRLSTVRNADRVVVIAEGRIVEIGSHAELLAKGGTYARLYTRSFQEGSQTLFPREPSPART